MSFVSTRLRIWIREVRAPFFTAAIVPTAIGAALAWYDTGIFDLSLFLLATLGVVLIHAGTNVVNDYFDYRNGSDVVNKNKSPFNGGSPFLIDGTLAPKQVYRGAIVLFALGGMIGLVLAYLVSSLILVLGVIGVFLGYCYTSPKVNLAARGIGEIAIGFGFGPLIVAGSYLIQTGTLALSAFLGGIPIGLLIALVLFINEFPDMEADRYARKNHWVVRVGLARASVWYAILMGMAFVSIVILWTIGIYPVWALIALIPAIVAAGATRIVSSKYARVGEIVPAQAKTIQVHLVTGLLICLGLVLSRMAF
ncbi:MAG: 1,4-dihydroxy-2-naphthoate octaprenyltransferase [Thermoplasmatota archaeon]|nr:1,4-dihydroxy-2-naphthoate octaprenyltransferase [Candidatus Thermoplasmatota archaeon]